jgi:primosomal protein N'
MSEDAAVKTLADPSDTSFFEEEDALRTALQYPPHGTLIALSWQGSLPVLDKLEPVIQRAAQGYEVRAVPDRVVRGIVHQRTRVLLLPKDAWPAAELARDLSMLPPSVRVMVDPESFW